MPPTLESAISQPHNVASARSTIVTNNVDARGSGSNNSLEEEGKDDLYADEVTELGNIRKRYTEGLNLSERYVRSWGCKEAFRESYQNWRDGILKSFKLGLSQFCPVYTEDKNVILVTIRAPNTEELLGFIRFQYDNEGYSIGGLKLANFDATLKLDDLGTGGTTKATDSRQTGKHGEGMKLSALVYRRNNYNFRIESEKFKWLFVFKRGKLCCCLSRISDKILDALKQKVKDQPRTPIACPWKDVCVIIGAPGEGLTAGGSKVQGNRIHVDDFKEWLKVTLDINPPMKMIRTNQGDLIRDPIYQERMYLRGLLLPSGGTSGKGYSYGYNFPDGSTTRDRDSLRRPGEESKRIAAIWAAAMRADDSEDSDITAEYTSLLINSLNRKGDAMLSSDSNCLPEDIAKMVWKRMLIMNKDIQGRSAFYYSAMGGKDEVHVIEQSLNRNPFPLDQEMWKMLSKYSLCRTPAEELLHRFQFAQIVDLPKNNFAAHVNRMLKCLLQSAPATKDMELTFVDGKNLQIDVGYFSGTWRIHDKWLTYAGAHENTYCEESSSEEDELFFCDHTVLQLWDIMISQLMASGEHPRIMMDEGWLKSMARGRLAQMPRSVKCATNDRKGELTVTWESVDSHQNKDKEVKVALHVEGCTEGLESLPVCPRDVLHCVSDDERQCNCPSQISQVVSDGVTFEYLDPDRAYFPSVSRDIQGAFIALQPSSMKPRSTDLAVTPETATNPVSGSGTTRQVPGIDNGNNSVNFSSENDSHYSLYRFQIRSSPPPALPGSGGADADVDITDDTSSQLSGELADQAASSATVTPRTVSQDRAVQVNRASQLVGESYVLGAKVEHRSLDWGGSFPGSHDFFRTRNTPDEDIFILKPKDRTINENGKRKRELDEPQAVHHRSKQPRREDVVNDSEG